MQPCIHEGRTFYEVNPYTDVFCLASLLLKHQNVTLIHKETAVSYRKFKDLWIARENEFIFISFIFDGSQSISKKNVEQLFSVFDDNHNKIEAAIYIDSDSIIRKGDVIKITLRASPNPPHFLYLIENEFVLVCMI